MKMQKIFEKPLFKETFGMLLIVAVLHSLAIYYYLYWTVNELDSLLHFLGGAFAGLATLWLYFFSGWFEPKKRTFLSFLLMTFWGLLFLAVAWEIFELLTGTAGVEWSKYPADTSLDFVMDTLGAIAACAYAYYREKQERIKARNIFPWRP